MSHGKDALFDEISRALAAGRAAEDIADDLWSRFGETSAVLVLDSTGFTRTTKTRGIAFFLTVISRLRKVGQEQFERHGATSWRPEADNLFASFATVDEAIAASFAIHAELAKHPIELTPGEALGACIGIGFGRLLRSQREGMYGDEMNLASKLGEDTAEGGETLLTHGAFANVSDPKKLTVDHRAITISGVTVPYVAVTRPASYAGTPSVERTRR